MEEEAKKAVMDAVGVKDEEELAKWLEGSKRARELREKLKSGDVTVNWNGHMKGGTGLNPWWKLEIYDVRPDGSLHTLLTHCYVCGEKLYFTYDGGDTIECTTECKYPNGLYPYLFEIDIPSGKIVMDDDLRHYTPEEVQKKADSADIMTEGGTIEYIEAYREGGLGIFFVGNTCPSVYRCGENKLLVGNLGTDEDDESNTLTKADLEIVEHDLDGDTESVASICTDLWWVSLMDHDRFMEACKKVGDDPEEVLGHWTRNVVNVTPGRYRVTYLGRGSDTYPEVFATIERIGDCE